MSNSLKFEEDFFRAMGTDISWRIVFSGNFNDQELDDIKKNIKKKFLKYEKIFSRFSQDSQLSEINRNLNKKIRVSREMIEVLRLCKKFNKISEGYFDPRIIGNLLKIGYKSDFKNSSKNFKGDFEKLEKINNILSDDLKIFSKERKIFLKKPIDTTGIVKGYTVDKVAKYLRKKGFSDFIIDAGGDIFASGLNQKQDKWVIGLEDFKEGAGILEITDSGVATSGVSRKKWKLKDKKVHHLINPFSPQDFSFDLKTVTVIESEAVEADGRAKSLFLMGLKEGFQFASKHKIKALFLDRDNNIYLTNETKKYLI